MCETNWWFLPKVLSTAAYTVGCVRIFLFSWLNHCSYHMATRVVCEFHLQSLIWIWRCLNTHMSNSVGILNVLLKVLMQYRTLCSFLNTTLVNNCTLIATSLSWFMVSPLRVRVYSFKHLCIIFFIIIFFSYGNWWKPMVAWNCSKKNHQKI